MAPPPDFSALTSAQKDALIATLLARLGAMDARVAAFRSEWGAKLYARIRSVLETARRRAINPLHAIRLTLDGCPLPDTG